MKKQTVSSHKSYEAAAKSSQQIESQTNHLATIRGDFLGSISSSTGSSPGYCNGVSEVNSQYVTQIHHVHQKRCIL